MSATPEREQAEALSETVLSSLRKQASRPGRAIDGGAAFTPVRDNILLALLDAVERERELTRALGHYANADHWAVEASDGDVYTTFSYDGGHSEPWKVAREALAGGVSAAGRPPEQDLGGGTADVAEAGEVFKWKAARECYEHVAAVMPQSNPRNVWDASVNLDTLMAILHAALFFPAAPEVLPEETRP